VDPIADRLRRHLPARMAHSLVRWKNTLFQRYIFELCRRRPQRAKQMLLEAVRAQLGPNYDVATHFTPRYNPWEQRLCVVPDGDLFRSIRAGRVSVVTDRIETFTATGIRLASGQELPADLVVTATGLKMKLLSGIELVVDGERRDPAGLVSYKGVMFSGLPNFVSVFGYFNASWTLKADLASEFVCRLLNRMERRGIRWCVPEFKDPSMPLTPFGDFSSGYVQRALADLPKQGPGRPWKLNQNYLVDLQVLRFGALEDGVLRFSA
jgi:monooxygenase